MYIHARVNPIVLSRGRRFERAALRHFQFRGVVSLWLRATKQLAIRLDGTFSTFNSHGEARECRANTHGDWKGVEREDGHSFPLFLPRIGRVRIQMRCNDHGIQTGCCTLLSRTGNHCVSHGPKAFRIYRSRRRAERFGSPEICTFLLFILVSRILPSRRYFLRGGNASTQPWVSV